MAKVAQSKITSKGQVTIPEEIRKELNLQPGDRIEWRAEKGKAEVRRTGGDWRELMGILHRPGMKALTVEEMDEGIARYIRKKHGDHRRR
jgi:AbrB family looped-hinge helix DNA binding protein